MLTQDFLVVMRAALAIAIGRMNAALRWPSQRNRHVQCPDDQNAFHSVTDGQANDAPRMQVKGDSRVEPAFAGSHVADVARLPISDWANLREDHHVLSLALAEGRFALGAITSWAGVHDLTSIWTRSMSAFIAMKANLICFAPQRTGWHFLTPPFPPEACGSLCQAPQPRVKDQIGQKASLDCAFPAGSNCSV